MSLQAQTGWEGPGPAARQDGPARPNDTPSIDSATCTTLTHHFPHTQLGPMCHGRTMTKTGACPAYVAAWHGMHRLGAALVSGGARSVLLGQGLRAPWLGSPPQGLVPHPLVTTLSSEAHHPPAGLTCGCLAHPLCAPISSIWSQLHFLWDMQTQTRASSPTTRGKAQSDLSPARDSRVLFLPPSCFLPLLSMSHLPCPWLLPSSHPPGIPHHTSPQGKGREP